MNNRQTGFALLIVLWTVGFLALLGTQLVAAGRSDTMLAENLKQQAVLAAAADGAVSQVMFRMLAVHDPNYQADGEVRAVRTGETAVQVRISNENDRVNINTATAPLLRALIIQVGGSPVVADRIAAAILVWRTGAGRLGPDSARDAYRTAGRAYGPPGVPFLSVEELGDVLGMTPDLLARMAPHLTVLTQGDPNMSTRDPLVARALSDAAGLADPGETAPDNTTDPVVRLGVTAIGQDAARYSMIVVASANFQNGTPGVKILLRAPVNDTTVVFGTR